MVKLNSWFLQRHAAGAAGGGAGAGSGASAGTAGSGSAVTGQSSAAAEGSAPQSTPNTPSFDDILKNPDYKKAYDERVGKAIQDRFKKANATEERLKSYDPLIAMTADKYGIKAKEDGSYDIEAIMKAANEDDSYYEQEALEKGIPVAEVKHMKSLEREVSSLKAAAEQRQQEEQKNAFYKALSEQSAATKAVYPGFDLDTEVKNPNFVRLINSGVPVKTAYEVSHIGEILPSAMQFGANKTAAQIAQSVAAGKARPAENGANGGIPAGTKISPASLTPEQRREYIERAKKGEKIHFS